MRKETAEGYGKMKLKAVLGIMLALLLISMLTPAFNFQQVKASGTIYIKADGSVDPPTAPITTADNVTYTFTGNISDEIVVQRSNITVDGNGYTLEGSGSGEGFYLSSVNNVTIQNINIKNFYYGVWLISSSNNTVSGNNITNNHVGIWLYSSSYNSISENNITNNTIYGVVLQSSSNNNSISGNNITNSEAGVRLESSSDNTVSGNNITNNYTGADIAASSFNTVSGNTIANNTYGAQFYAFSNNNSISENNITNNNHGVVLGSTSNNTVSGNNITNNINCGVRLDSSSNNKIYHNNFINNTQQVYIQTSGYANFWDDGYPSGGNYWSDYDGTDLYCGPYQNETGSDGIGDTPYVVGENNTDRYPLVKPYGAQHDIGITSITTSRTIIGQGYSLHVNIRIVNYGVNAETFNVTAYYNPTPTLEQREVFWSMGDVNRDGYIDDTDGELIQAAWLSTPGDPNWNPDADLNGDLIVYIDDVSVWSSNYGLDIWTYFNLSGITKTQTVTLTSGNSITITFTWNTTGVPYGNYTISAVATPVPGETDIVDNTLIDGCWFLVTVAGDVNVDGIVDIFDGVPVAAASGAKLITDPQDPRFGEYWHDETCPRCPHNPLADINQDGVIDGLDLEIVENNYGKTW